MKESSLSGKALSDKERNAKLSAKVERLEAELALEKLEAKFVEAKASGKVTNKMKDEVREARRVFRSEHRDRVTVAPGTVATGTKVQSTGGGN